MMRFTTMKTKLRKYPSIFLILLLAISSCFLTGCVNQHPKDSKKSSQGESVETMLEITDPKEKQAVLNAKAKVKALSGNQGSSQHLRLLQIFVTSWILILSVYQRAVFPKFHQDTKR